MSKKLIELSNKIKSNIYLDYDIGKKTWFRTGGKAKVFVLLEDVSELEIILNEINNDKFDILGSGSNLLVRDDGYNGTILKLGKGFNSIKIKTIFLKFLQYPDVNLSNFALRNNIEGFEFYSGIPGSVGGAKMNAGCFGSETSDIINSVEIYDKFKERKIINKNDINLTYRNSNIKDYN